MLGAIGDPAEYATVRLSPDDKRVALERSGDSAGVTLMDVASGIATRLTFNAFDSDPIWSPDGRELVLTDYRSDALHRRVVGTNKDEVLLPGSGKGTTAQNGCLTARRFSSSTRMVDRSTVCLFRGLGNRSCFAHLFCKGLYGQLSRILDRANRVRMHHLVVLVLQDVAMPRIAPHDRTSLSRVISTG